MYVPKAFEESRIEVLHELMRSHPFGTLITHTVAGLEANHLPLVLTAGPSPLGMLRGHVARANAVWRDVQPEMDALVLFHGPHAYISPSWYPSKQATGKVVPTWNYAVVHARGPLRIVQDAAWLRSHLEALTDGQETGRERPWRVADAPGEYLDKLMGAIVGIEIPITDLSGKWKASQNRPDADRAGVVNGLLKDGGAGAAAMARLVAGAMR